MVDKYFYKMKEKIGSEAYDVLSIITGTLLHEAILFLNKLGVLEEFLKGKNEICRDLIKSILEVQKEAKE